MGPAASWDMVHSVITSLPAELADREEWRAYYAAYVVVGQAMDACPRETLRHIALVLEFLVKGLNAANIQVIHAVRAIIEGCILRSASLQISGFSYAPLLGHCFQ